MSNKFYTNKNYLHGQFNIQLKNILPRKRRVSLSKELQNKIISNTNNYSIIQEIYFKSINGNDLSPYLSKQHNNTGTNDKILNATGFYHLHMNHQSLDDEVGRSNNLLFVYPTDDMLYLINYHPHKDWTKHIINLYNIILKNWKELLQYHSSPREPTLTTENDICKAIMNNFQPILTLNDNNAYSLLGRITTDGSSGKILSTYDKYMHNSV